MAEFTHKPSREVPDRGWTRSARPWGRSGAARRAAGLELI